VRPSKVIQFGLAAMLLSLTFSAAAQQPQRVPLLGYVSIGDPKNPGSRIEAFRQSLHDLGYTEGKTSLLSIATFMATARGFRVLCLS
jgi:hypothetical protein